MINNNTYRITVQAISHCDIKPYERVKVTRQGAEYLDIAYMERKVFTHVKRIDKDTYINLKTGRIMRYDRMSAENLKKSKRASLTRSMRELQRLIRTNFTAESPNQLFLTLTYKENMTDPDRLYSDFKIFIKTLRRQYREHILDYIVVAEPQGRGAWHMHVMLKSNQPILFVDNKRLEAIWGHGFTDAQRLKSSDVGTYYVAYFTDLLTDCENLSGAEMSKAKIKGGRLKYYPKGFKFYRCSRGVSRPDLSEEFMFEISDETAYEKIYEKAYEIIKEDVTPDADAPERLNRIYRATYRKKRPKDKGAKCKKIKKP